MHRIVSHRTIVIWLRSVVATIYSHAVSSHVLRSSRRCRRHHRRGGALTGATHTVWRCSCKSCCRNNRGAYKIRGFHFFFFFSFQSVARVIFLFLSLSLFSRAYALWSFKDLTFVQKKCKYRVRTDIKARFYFVLFFVRKSDFVRNFL